MREIKFRYACKDMAGDLFFHYFNLDDLTNRPIPLAHIGRIQEIIGRDQFTGLRDKQGKEIWEGDVLQCPAGKGVVVWGNHSIGRDDWGIEHITPGFSLAWEDDSGHSGIEEKDRVEVIGNIHENPELLATPAP